MAENPYKPPESFDVPRGRRIRWSTIGRSVFWASIVVWLMGFAYCLFISAAVRNPYQWMAGMCSVLALVLAPLGFMAAPIFHWLDRRASKQEARARERETERGN